MRSHSSSNAFRGCCPPPAAGLLSRYANVDRHPAANAFSFLCRGMRTPIQNQCDICSNPCGYAEHGSCRIARWWYCAGAHVARLRARSSSRKRAPQAAGWPLRPPRAASVCCTVRSSTAATAEVRTKCPCFSTWNPPHRRHEPSSRNVWRNNDLSTWTPQEDFSQAQWIIS